MTVKNSLATNRIIMLILLCYPVLLLTVQGGMNALFFLLLILSVFCLYRAPKSLHKDQWDAYTLAFALAMASPIFAVFLSQSYHGEFTARSYDGPSRFLLAVPIYLTLRQIKISTLTMLQYGLPLGAISALLVVFIVADHQPFFPRAGNTFVNPIHFGDLALIMGFLSLFSINWAGRDPLYIVILKSLGLLAGLFVSVQSESRGGWIAIPVVLFTWLIIQNKERGLLRLLMTMVPPLLFGITSYFLINIIHQRVDEVYSDIVAAWHGNLDTSIGIRLQLWETALYLFRENPIFGVGPNGYAPLMSTLTQSGLITEIAADNGRGEVHNFIFANMARLGIFGLLSALAIFFVPFVIFIKTTKSDLATQRKASMMGICLVLGVFIFGLSVETFNLKMVAAFYSLTLAVLLAIATNKTIT
jgi:O-antigen ligase